MKYFYGRFEGDAEGLTREMFSSPALAYYWLMFHNFEKTVGAEEADRIFLKASIELLRKHPMIGVEYFLRNLASFFIIPPMFYVNASDPEGRIAMRFPVMEVLYRAVKAKEDTKIPDGIVKEICFDPFVGVFELPRKGIVAFWALLYIIFRPILFVMMLAGAFLLFKTKHRPVACLFFMLIAYQALVYSVFSTPMVRYVQPTIPLEFILAIAGFLMTFQRRETIGEEADAT